MNESLSGLSRSERRAMQQVLREGEELQMLVRPRVRLLDRERLAEALILGFLMLVVLAFLSVHVSAWEDLLCWLVLGLTAVIWFWRYLRARYRHFYLLTSQRAVIVKNGKQLFSYDRDPGMIKAVIVRADGSGDVVLGYSFGSDRGGWYTDPSGFMNVPKVMSVVEAMASRLSSLPADIPAPEVDPPDGCTPWMGGLFIVLGLWGLIEMGEVLLAVLPAIGVDVILRWWRRHRKTQQLKQQLSPEVSERSE